MCNFKVSPQYCGCHLRSVAGTHGEIDAMVDVFEDRVNGWFLDHAQALQDSKDQHVGFAVLMITFSYFEQYAQYEKGQDSNSQSCNYFKDGFLSVFPELNKLLLTEIDILIDITYGSARCGFFHSGMTKSDFFIRDNHVNGDPVVFENNKIYIDRYKFLDRVRNHFCDYVLKLRNKNNVQLRTNFESFWRLVNKGKIY